MTNEAAERLRGRLRDWTGGFFLGDLDEALADARRAGVAEERERIRASIESFGGGEDHDQEVLFALQTVLAIVDAKQPPSAKPTADR